MLRREPWYRRQAFEQGLVNAGYQVVQGEPARGAPGEVLCIWNRYGHWHDVATRFERDGGTVVVAENGYLGAGGTSPKFDVHPKGPQPHHYYALGIGWHNGRGVVAHGGPERLNALGVELAPWRTAGDHVLVCPNRSFGVGEQVMRADWAERRAEQLRKHTRRPVRVRAHPGNDEPKRHPLEADLRGAWGMVIWSSSCGVHALAAGIPVYVEAPYWVMKGASASGPVDAPVMPDRLPHFVKMSWAQWTLAEISEGTPFKCMLNKASC